MKLQSIFFLPIFFFAFSLSAQQTILKGQVSIHNSKYNTGAIQYVENAYANAPFTSPDDTDSKGIFNLEFVGMDGGTSIKIKVEKDGLEVVNDRDLNDIVIGRKK